MKLRKKDFEVPKNFSISRWIIKDLHGGILRFPPLPLVKLIFLQCLNPDLDKAPRSTCAVFRTFARDELEEKSLDASLRQTQIRSLLS